MCVCRMDVCVCVCMCVFFIFLFFYFFYFFSEEVENAFTHHVKSYSELPVWGLAKLMV